MSSDDDKARRDSEDLLAIAEARRAQSDTFAWSVPGLAIASQAFLLSIALGADTQPAGRLIASLAGLLALLATGHLMTKQAHNFDVYEGVIENERKNLCRPSVQMDALKAAGRTYPPNTQLVKRGWLEPEKHPWLDRLVMSKKAVLVWLWALGGFFVIDVLLAIYASLVLVLCDPGWL